MKTAIIIDDSFSTSYNPNTGRTNDGYVLRAEIVIAEAYLRRHPDAEIIGLVAGPVSDFDQLVAQNGTPIKGFLDALEDFDRVVLIMDGALDFVAAQPQDAIKQRINDFRKSLNDTELQIVIVMEPDMTVQNLGSPALFPSSEAAGTREREESFLMRRLLLPYITMIVDPRAILDFGF